MANVWVRWGVVGALIFSPFFTFAAAPCPYGWERDLRVGMTGDDVARLQQYLNVAPQSGYFGVLTKAAVTKLQEQYPADILVPNGLASGTGFFGPSTRAKLNNLCSGQSTVDSLQQTLGLTVMAGEQPAHTIAPANAGYVPFTNFTLTAGDTDVVVSSVTVQRVGPASDQVFYDLVLFDDSGEYDATGYLNSNHLAVFKKPLTIPAHTSKVMTVVGDMNTSLTGQDGQMAGLMVTDIKASAPVSGPLPIMGTLQTANASLVIGSVTAILGATDPRTARTRYITDTDITFSSIRITAGSQEDVVLNSIAWYQSGSATLVDLANVRTVINGVSYPVVTDGRYYTSTFPDGIVIKKGDSIEAAIQGDLTGSGSNRTVAFDISEGADADFAGMTYGFGIFVIPGGNTDVSGARSAFLTQDGTVDTASITPFFAGSITTISPGAFSGINKSN